MELKHYTFRDGLTPEDIEKYVDEFPPVLKELKPHIPLDVLCAYECKKVYLKGTDGSLIEIEEPDEPSLSGASLSQKMSRFNPFSSKARGKNISPATHETLRTYFISAGSHGLRMEAIIVNNEIFEKATMTGQYSALLTAFEAAKQKN